MAPARRDFDKDYIFNLIMPTSPAQEAAPEPEPIVQEDPAQDSLSLLRERINQKAGLSTVQLRSTKELVLVNLMEQLVADRLDEAFEKFNCCRCDKCRQDAAALALNALPPRYVVAEPDALPGLLAGCSTKEVYAALVKAILQVKSHPQH